MQLKQKKTNPLIIQDILVISDCLGGAEKAASFASRNLHLEGSTMVLLQTYQNRSYGQSMIRNIKPLLEKTACRELSELKNQIVGNNGINPESISKVVMEGDLLSVLKQRFGNKTDIAVVLGFDQGNPKPDYYCKKLIISIIKSGIRPFYIIDNGITMIGRDIVTYFSGQKNLLDDEFYRFLSRIFIGLGLKQSIMVTSADPLLEPDEKPVDSPDSNNWRFKDEYALSEKLFKNLKEGKNDFAIRTVKLS